MRSYPCWLNLFADLLRFLALGLRSKSSLAAENLFLRKQLAFYQERKIRPRRLDNSTRLALVRLSRWFDWRNALTVVTPKTLIGWHRKGFRLYWRRKCQSGRPRIPRVLQQLIRRMAGENPSWGEERIANELALKLGLRVSPRTLLRSFGVGLVHGLAGSAAIALLVLSAIPRPLYATLYLAIFCTGTIVGMALITIAIAAPLAVASSRMSSLHRRFAAAAGLRSFGFGIFLAYRIAVVDRLFGGVPIWTPH